MPPSYRSRAIWDKTRSPSSTPMDLVRAIFYEIQPFRIGPSIQKANIREVVEWVKSFLRLAWSGVLCVPMVCAYAWSMFRTIMMDLTWGQIKALCGVFIYLFVVRYLHRALEAGPIVVISTGIVVIVTVGLSDGEHKEKGMSAYSVFNRGCKAIMGSIDADSLVAQHVGGGLAFANNQHQHQHNQMDNHGVLQPGHRPTNQNQNHNPNNNGNNGPNQKARKSGKKARRKDLEHRKNRQRQRQAAAAMGFGGDGGMEEAQAMNRLLDDHDQPHQQQEDEEEDFGIQLQEAGFDA